MMITSPVQVLDVDSQRKAVHGSGPTYRVIVWARTKGDPCAPALTEQLATYVSTHYCRQAARILDETTINGRPVAFAQTYVSFGEPPDWQPGGSTDIPGYRYAGGFIRLAAQDGTGDMRTLLGDGYRFAGSGSGRPSSYAFDDAEDSGAEIAEA